MVFMCCEGGGTIQLVGPVATHAVIDSFVGGGAGELDALAYGLIPKRFFTVGAQHVEEGVVACRVFWWGQAYNWRHS